MEETREIIFRRPRRSVISYDPKTGLSETRYESISQAAYAMMQSGATNTTNVSTVISGISNTCRGKSPTIYGHAWKFEGDPYIKFVNQDTVKNNSLKGLRAVAKYDLNGKLLVVYKNCAEAARAIATEHTNDNITSISGTIGVAAKSDALKTAYGYKWRLVGEICQIPIDLGKTSL